MVSQLQARRRSRAAQILSTILFVAALGFAGAAAWLWYTDASKDGPGTPPPAESAANIDLAQVLMVLDQSNDGWDYGRSPAAVHADQLQVPGQHLKLDDTSLFVFIFTGATAEDRVAAREAAGDAVDLDTLTLSTGSGAVINDGGKPIYMIEHSSVLCIMVGGDDDLAKEVATALGKLP
jgi:hypothetical protein